jgi:large subunit ribosomal protein L10
MPNNKNVELLKNIQEKVAKSKSILLSDFKGVNSKDLTSFREDIRSKGGEVFVSKNTLLKIALKGMEGDEKASDSLAGQTVAVVAYDDPISTIKAFFDFAKKVENLKAKGGFFESKFVDEKGLIEISKLPSKEELIGRLIGSMNSPVYKFVNTLNQSKSKIVYVLSSISSQKNNQ